ncbi:hypothetical protein OROGR_026248 [Orobanche gracilis]
MENFQSICSPTGFLLCRENVAGLEDKGKGVEESPGSVLDDGYDDEYIRALLDKEMTCGGLQLQDYLQGSWIEKARLDGIQYILRKNELLGFRFQTAYASVVYLDRFLSTRSIDGDKSWAMRLLSMACLSLAAKMEETTVPPLSEFCAKDCNFESRVIQRMELLVLNELGWKLGLITPFDFLGFFTNKFFHKSLTRNVVSRTGEVILGVVRDARIMCNRPSVIAAAATLFVLDQGFTRDALLLKIGTLASTHSLDVEKIVSCYYLVHDEMEIERSNVSKGIIKSPDLSPIQLQRAEETYGSSSITSTSKRKRLVFGHYDLFDDVLDKKGKP